MINGAGTEEVKSFNLPGRTEQFVMVGDFVYRADNMKQVFARDEQGNWTVIRSSTVQDPAWISILEKTYSQ